jgi:hypothetical protein
MRLCVATQQTVFLGAFRLSPILHDRIAVDVPAVDLTGYLSNPSAARCKLMPGCRPLPGTYFAGDILPVVIGFPGIIGIWPEFMLPIWPIPIPPIIWPEPMPDIIATMPM